MKTLVALSVTLNPSRGIRQPRSVQYRLASKRSLLSRFCHFIESTDWEDRYICARWIDRVCLGGMALSALYFTTGLVWSLLK